MSMIQNIRETVLSVLNKNNYGYISPIDFNLFAKQAQLDIFEDYFYYFNQTINAENMRQSGTDHADIARQTQEVIDTFTQFKSLALTTGSQQTFNLPDDWYSVVLVEWASNCEIAPSYPQKEAERVNEYNIKRLLSSNLTAPSPQFPAYVFSQMGSSTTVGPGTGTYGDLGNQITLYPAKTGATCSLACFLTYIRYPKDPMWTYNALGAGEPIFNPSAALGYQDFELPQSDAPALVNKILQYSGMSIREIAAIQFGTAQENDIASDQAYIKTPSPTRR